MSDSRRPSDWRGDAGQVLRRLADEQAVGAVAFPIYAAEGIAARVCGRGRIGERITQITLAQEPEDGRRLTVETALATNADPGEDVLVLSVLDSSSATVAGRPIVVNGQKTLFAYAEAGGRWAAVLYTRELNLIVTGVGIATDEIRLAPVADPASLLD